VDPKPKKPESPSAPAGSKQAGELPPDVSRIVQEAESIARGDDPAAASNDAGTPKPGTDGDGTRAPSPAIPLPSDADRKMARRIVALTDKAFVSYFGAGAGFEPVEQDIAVEDWAEIVAQYLPKVLAGSPGWRLVGLYLAHLGFCVLGTQWMDDQPARPAQGVHVNGSSPATSDGADPARRTS
jgi:hypothetical protein